MAESKSKYVKIQHPKIEGQPTVLRTALKHMSTDWKIVEDIEADPGTPGSRVEQDATEEKTSDAVPAPVTQDAPARASTKEK